MKKLSKILLIALFANLYLFADDSSNKEEPTPVPPSEVSQNKEEPTPVPPSEISQNKEEPKDDSEVNFVPADEINYDEDGNVIQNEEAVG